MGTSRKGWTRRSLLAAAGGTAGALAVASVASAQQQQPQAPDDPTKVQGYPASALGTRSTYESPRRLPPANPTPLMPSSSRTPLDTLDGIITPADLHFERHHSTVPTIDPAKYSLTIHGMVDRPMVFSLADLKRLPGVSRIMFLECAGNSAYAKQPEMANAQAIHGLTSTSNWGGVLVSTLLNAVGVRPGAAWALAMGGDAASMTRSVPLDKLMSDAMIAYSQNGEALRPENGYPARLLLPGWEGNINVKWLRKLELGDQPWHTKDETSNYTDPMPDGTIREFTFVQEAKSVITYPTTVTGNIGGQGPLEIRGLAWSGRGRIARVDVSTDGGATWTPARLDEPVLPMAHTRFRTDYNWQGQEATLMSRATDETGYMQPTREQLVAVRGTNSRYHNNGTQVWRIASDGAITNYYLA